MIHFTKHAREKFDILKEHDFRISRDEVINTIENPDLIDYSRYPLLIAQKRINNHVLRVVYKIKNNIKIIITFYPGRIKQYEQ